MDVLKKRLRQGLMAGGLVIGLVAAFAPTADAKVIANTGSDTTYNVTNGLANQFDAESGLKNCKATANDSCNPLNDTMASIIPTDITPFGMGMMVDGDADCPADYLYTNEVPAGVYNNGGSSITVDVPPNGSSSGISKLNTAQGANGCVDLARSSRDKRASDPANFDFYAYATDAVSLIRFPGAPAGAESKVLTFADVQKIYVCDAATHDRVYKTWGDLLGTASTAPIKKYAAQTGSGTYAFFNTKWLAGNTVDQNCDGAGSDPYELSTFVQEHSAATIPATDRANAIYYYGWGPYLVQAKRIVPDLRNGAQWFSVTNGAGFTGVPNNVNIAENGTFPARRYVYNVVRNSGTPSLASVKTFATNDPAGGAASPQVDAFGNGWVCSGKAGNVINAWGLRALPPLVDPDPGVNHTSWCRKNPAAL